MRMSRRMGVYSQGKKIRYYGTAATLGDTYAGYAAAPVGNYAVFNGGDNAYGTVVRVAYDSNLTAAALSNPYYKRSVSAAHNPSYAVFAGGYVRDEEDRNSDAFCYDSALVYSKISGIMGATAGKGPSANKNYSCNFGDYAVFGYYYGSGDAYKGLYFISSALVKTHVTTSAASGSDKACAANSNYAIMAGGAYGSPDGTGSAVATGVDTSLVEVTVGNLSQARGSMTAAAIGENMLFFGGSGSSMGFVHEISKLYSAVDCYDANLLRTTLSPMSAATGAAVCAPFDKGIVVAGGITSDGPTAAAELYDRNLVKSGIDGLATASYGQAACRVGKYAIFGNGDGSPCDVYVA